MTTYDMGVKHGLSRSSVSDRAKAYGLPRRKGGVNPYSFIGARRPDKRHALTGGEWVIDPVRRVQVWRSNS